MPADHTHPITATTAFDDIVDRLGDLTRHHALAYRLEVGQVLLDAFYGGDLHAYQTTSPDKHVRFEEFLRERQEPLARMGLSGRLARQCIRAHGTWRTLPPAVREGLGLGQLSTLTRLGDATQRVEVAVAALQHGWTLQQLVDAVAAVKGGATLNAGKIAAIEGVDGLGGQGEGADAGGGADAARSGDAAAGAALPRGSRQPGRLVTEAERWSAQLEGWALRWGTVELGKLRAAQRQRVLDAAARLEAQAAALRERLEREVGRRG
jgi:hypothetical protein